MTNVEIIDLDIAEIRPSGYRPDIRGNCPDAKFDAMVDNMRENGYDRNHPIIVRKSTRYKRWKYEIVDGNTRFHAWTSLGNKTISSIIIIDKNTI